MHAAGTTSKSKPGYRKQKRKGKAHLAFVEINGTRRYLGTYGTPESHQRYAAAIAEWESSGHLPIDDPSDLRVVELVDRYLPVAELHYRRPDGTPTSELDLMKRALAVLVELYGNLPAKEFSPLKLKAVRNQMIGKGWCRKVTNDMTQRVKRLFRWATENELVPATVNHALNAVAGLRQGRSEARDSDPVLPVPEHMIDPVTRHLAPQVAAIIQLQLLTGARPGELCVMRGCDIDMSGKVWTYKPPTHKTQHHGHKRVIYLGPKAQAVVREYLKPDVRAFLFSPAEAEQHHREQRHLARTTPLHYGNSPGTNRKRRPRWQPGERYTVNTYRRAILRGCDAAFPPPEHLAPKLVEVQRTGKTVRRMETREQWLARQTKEQRAELKAWRKAHRWNPHRLRHNAATRLRHEFGIDLAQTILGHRLGSTVTEIYAAANVKKACEVMEQIG